MSPLSFAAEVVGTPYVAGGVSATPGYNCWGLVVDAYKRIYGIDLPTFTDLSIFGVRGINVGFEAGKGSWEELLEPEDGCVAMIGTAATFYHVGLFISGQGILHAKDGFGVIIQSKAELMRTSFPRVVYYRHVDCSNNQ